MPKPENSPSAVVVSGGKQYRVAVGDRILVDRLAAEAGSSVKLGRVLLVSDGNEVRVGSPVVEGVDVDARVLSHRRGPRIESIRYKAKKRVRVHRGGRADLTALEILAIGGVGSTTTEQAATAEKDEEAKPKGRGRRKAEPKKPRAEAAAEVKDDAPAGRAQGASDKKPPRRRASKKEDE